MNPVTSEDIVFSAWVREVIHLNLVLDALADEIQAVLPEHGIVDGALTDEQFALQVLGLVDEACFRIALRIALHGIHIALSVHDFVPFPVDYRTACDSDLEDFRIGGHERNSHETAIAPSVYADSVLVDVRKCHELADTCNLVSHFSLSAVVLDGLLIFCTPVFCTPVVLDIDDIAVLCHIELPKADLAEPAVLDHLGMRTSIDIKHYRIFLRRVEVRREEQTVPVVVFAVGALYCTESHFAVGVFLERVFSSEQCPAGLAVNGSDFDDVRDIETAV